MQFFQNVQALRGIAAMMVAVGHAATFHLVVAGEYDLFIANYSGVDIFFVISGFIICSSAVKHEASPWRFLVRRLGRIFPIYWVVLTASAVAALWGAIGGTLVRKMPEHSVTDYVLLLTTENRFIPQAWTLSYELYFYVWISAALLLGRSRLWVAIIALMSGHAFMVGRALLGGFDPGAFVTTSWLVFEFGMGCGVAFLCSRGGQKHFIGGALALATLFFAAGTVWTMKSGTLLASLPRTITFGVGSAALLYAAVSAEAKGILMPRWLQKLGDASYSIYLWHFLVFELATRAIPVETFVTMPTRNVFGATVFFVLIGLSFATHHLIERPATRVVGRLLAVGPFRASTRIIDPRTEA